ncbi:hypothetical protein AB0L53_31520 [Nonomuraea sp. NPDC052129]|uniref:hypothetical protein n=1 Tax=Nonomuraea sp. NPDC052129 TaxID=3154651 RepID=UPI00342504DF
MARHTTPEQQADEPTEHQEDEQAQALAKTAAAVARKTAFRYRHAIAPHAVVAGVWGTGVALYLADVPAWQVLAGEAAVYAAAAAVRAFVPKTREPLALRWWQVGAGAWLPAAAELGATGVMQSLFFAVAGAWTVPYMWRNRSRILRPEKKPRELEAAQQAKALETDPTVTRWNIKTAGKRGALPGAVLAGRQEFAHGGAEGVRYRIGLDGQTTEDAMAARKRICSDFGRAINYVHVEEPEGGEQNAAMVTFLKKLAVEDPQLWTEPLINMETGVMPIGPFEDGAGDSALQVWEPGSGPLPCGIFGSMRTGKSSILKIAVAEFARTGGKIVLDYLDPQGGQSCPSLLPYTPNARGIDEIRDRLRAYREEMRRRNEFLATVEWTDEEGEAQLGVQSYDYPGAHGLDMRITAIDEFHKVARHDDLAEIVYDILAEGSKCGMTVWILDQNVYVNSLGGGDILALVTSGNVVVTRNSDARIASATFGARMAAYPHLIKLHFPGTQKPTKGCAYLLGATSRPVMTRARHIPKMRAAMQGTTSPSLTWMGGRSGAPAPARSEHNEVAAQEVVSLDAPVQLAALDPGDVAAAQEVVLSLLASASEGLTGPEVTVRSGLSLPVAFRVAASLTEQGRARMAGDRYVIADRERVA